MLVGPLPPFLCVGRLSNCLKKLEHCQQFSPQESVHKPPNRAPRTDATVAGNGRPARRATAFGASPRYQRQATNDDGSREMEARWKPPSTCRKNRKYVVRLPFYQRFASPPSTAPATGEPARELGTESAHDPPWSLRQKIHLIPCRTTEPYSKLV